MGKNRVNIKKMNPEYTENYSETVAARARGRITRRLMPFLICLFVIAFIDRVNVGYAALEMNRELGFNPEILGFGAGIFFFGYFLFEIPGSLLVETWSARKWLARNCSPVCTLL